MGTPLRNSKGVNKPFASPFKNIKRNTQAASSPLSRSLNTSNYCTKSPTSSFSSRLSSSSMTSPSMSFSNDSTLPYDKKSESNPKCKKNITNFVPLFNEQKKKIDFTEPKESSSERRDILSYKDLDQLRVRVRQKEKELKNLNVKLVLAKKEDLQDLPAVIKKWRTSCQEVLEALYRHMKETREGNVTMSDIIQELHISKELVHFSDETLDFTD